MASSAPKPKNFRKLQTEQTCQHLLLLFCYCFTNNVSHLEAFLETCFVSVCVCASPLYLFVFAKEEQYRYGNMKTISLFLIFVV